MSRLWLPLESNPEVWNQCLVALGLPKPKVEFNDVFGVDPELLAMVPRPIRAMLFLYPITPRTEEEDTKLIESQRTEAEEFMTRNKFFFSKQTIGNACGTMAILHALINNIDFLGEVTKGSPLDFFSSMEESTPIERAKLIEECEQLDQVHMDASLQGSTEKQSINLDTDLHFVCFVRVNNRCVELDGRKPFPILHDCCNDEESFAAAAAAAISAKMQRDPESLRFNIIALSDKSTE